MMKILDVYRKASGYEVNIRKSWIFFSMKTSVVDRSIVMGILAYKDQWNKIVT